MDGGPRRRPSPLGEIEKGILKLQVRSRRRGMEAWLRELRSTMTGRILPFGEGEASAWAHYFERQRAKGRVLPTIDSMLAATAKVRHHYHRTMIDRQKDVVEWALLGSGLHEAREHLDSLIKDMESPDFDEVSFGCQLSHIYAHLNTAWNGRDKRGAWTDADYERFKQYPRDLQPDEGWPSREDTADLIWAARWHIRIHRLLCTVIRPFKRKPDA